MQQQMQDGFSEGFQDAEVVLDAVTVLRSKGQAEAIELCGKSTILSAEPVPATSPSKTSEHALQRAEVLYLQAHCCLWFCGF
eukprot:jgi/Ulvmu1/4166/UM019_0145.1